MITYIPPTHPIDGRGPPPKGRRVAALSSIRSALDKIYARLYNYIQTDYYTVLNYRVFGVPFCLAMENQANLSAAF